MAKNKYATKVNRKKALHLFKKVDVWLPKEFLKISEQNARARNIPLNVYLLGRIIGGVSVNFNRAPQFYNVNDETLENEILNIVTQAGNAGLYFYEIYALISNDCALNYLSAILNNMISNGLILNDDQLFKSALKPKKVKVKKIAGRDVVIKKPKKLKKLMNKPTT